MKRFGLFGPLIGNKENEVLLAWFQKSNTKSFFAKNYPRFMVS
jgi:hypothetical protein